MASLRRGWVRALLPQLATRYASHTAPWHCFASSRITTRGLATSKAKRAPRKRTKETTKANDDASDLDPRLPVLSLASLRDVALLCGRNSSGTRAVLRADLEAIMDEAPALPTQKSASTQRILSIDMGVRNLAYCLLQVDAASARSKKAPKLIAWERLSLIGGEKGVTEDGTAQTKLPASAFSPPTMAVAAARLIRGRLLPLAPTHVLIERQRFRSGGGAAVLEWTVRVNSLEAMLHGIFAYRQLDVSTSGENTVQTVQAVNPQRVSQFLLRGGLGDSSGSQTPSLPAKSTKEKYIKDVKETFVAGILRSTGPQKLLTYDERINSIVDAYLLRWDAKQSKSRKKVKTNVTEEKEPTSSPKPVFSKIDDLADCVAQGLAWLEWEDNRRILREMGAERLLVAKKIAG